MAKVYNFDTKRLPVGSNRLLPLFKTFATGYNRLPPIFIVFRYYGPDREHNRKSTFDVISGAIILFN